MDTLSKTFKIHYPRRSGKIIFNKTDYNVRIVGEETEDFCEVILEEIIKEEIK